MAERLAPVGAAGALPEVLAPEGAPGGWTRNTVKYVAAAAMVLDHIAVFCLSPGEPAFFLFRFLGRLTMPVMCLFLAEGFRRTSSRRRYGMRLLIFSLLSEPAYAMAHGREWWAPPMNVMCTLFIGFCMLWIWETIRNRALCCLSLLALLVLSGLCDWGLFAPAWVLVCYLTGRDRHRLIFCHCLLSSCVLGASVIGCLQAGQPWYWEIWQAGLFGALPIMLCYRGRGGSRHSFHRWFFYLFYPLHLLLFGLLP